MINDSVRIRLSLGLIVVAIIHAILLGLVFAVLHDRPTHAVHEQTWTVPSYHPSAPSSTAIQRLQEPQSVNLQAQGEIKQQIRNCTPNCQPHIVNPAPINVQPPAVRPNVLPNTVPAQVTQPNFSTPTPAAATPSVTPVSAPATPPPKKTYQLALFIGNDATSTSLQRWFVENKQLVALKESCEFQVYTADNAIYKTRFADLVPPSQFPVVLFQDETGGHVHAAGRSMIPGSAEELFSDLKHGYTLYNQAKQAQKTGAVKTRGYSWDDAITPTLYLSAEDCLDGYCPKPEPDDRRPFNRVRDLFNDATDTRNALMWLSAGEIATIALIGIAAVLIVFIIVKRGVS